MGLEIDSLPINELVAILNELDTSKKSNIKNKFPELGDEIDPGVWAGENVCIENGEIILTKARFASEVLGIAILHSKEALKIISSKIQRANKIRLLGQIGAVVGSSGTILAMGFGKETVAQVSAVLALFGSISSILSAHTEKTISTKTGNINEVYLNLSGQLQEAIFLRNNINAHIQYKSGTTELVNLISMSNELCRKINKNTLQVPQLWHKISEIEEYKNEILMAEGK